MRTLIYRYDGMATRSILRATLVAAVETDELPEDQEAFAHGHGGHFLEIEDSDDLTPLE
jgi:hypothetical protein